MNHVQGTHLKLVFFFGKDLRNLFALKINFFKFQDLIQKNENKSKLIRKQNFSQHLQCLFSRLYKKILEKEKYFFSVQKVLLKR